MLRSCARLVGKRRLQAQAWTILTMRSDYKSSAMAVFSVSSERPITWLAVRSQVRRKEKRDDWSYRPLGVRHVRKVSLMP